MAEVHVLKQNGHNLELVLHIPIPGGNNSAGVSWQTALVNSGLVQPSILKDGDGTGGTIDATEKAALASGALFERVLSYDMGTDFDGLNGAQKNAKIDGIYAAQLTDLQGRLQERLKYCGYTREVP